MGSKEDMLEELNLIQDIIERQANNSFLIKGWVVTLVVVALIFKTDNFQLIGAFIPLLGFWGLDAYYLKQENKYRELYDWVRKNREDTDEHLFDMDASRFEDDVDGIVRTMLSKTLLAFYGAISLLLAVYSYAVIYVYSGGLFG